ncbi:GNAT family N-acetyltransferase [Paenibacillus durus]|uniref:GNAT family N-acetyltransferase n=1 Tax=Paenibacillus durus TaxID=44251 RepID=UPI0009DD732C
MSDRNEKSEECNGFSYAIVDKDNHALMGCISLNLVKPHQNAELGYWLGRSYWGMGYVSRGGKAVNSFRVRRSADDEQISG